MNVVLVIGLMLEAAEDFDVGSVVTGRARVAAESGLEFRVDENALYVSVAMERLHELPVSFHIEVR